MPYPLPLTRTEAYLAYKAGVIQQSDLKPSLAVPRNGIDAWLAYWTGLTDAYPVKKVSKNLFSGDFSQFDNTGGVGSLYAYFKLPDDGVYTLTLIAKNDVTGTSGTFFGFTTTGGDGTNPRNWVFYQGLTMTKGGTRSVTNVNGGVNQHYVSLYLPSRDTFQWFMDNFKIQLEKGSTATPYEPYTSTPLILQEEEAYIAYLCGVINEYPEKCLHRVGAYLRYLISARWGRPDHPTNREELYLSLIKTQFIPSGDPSSDIVIDGTAKAAFVDVKMYGDTYQQSYTGKNLWAYSNDNWFYDAQNTSYEITQDGELKVTATAGTYQNSDFIVSLADGTYTFSLGSVSVSNPNMTTKRMTLSKYNSNHTGRTLVQHIDEGTPQTVAIANETGKVYVLEFWATYESSISNTTTFSNVQIEAGSAATDYEKFVGGIPSPNPDYPQPIQTVTGEQTVEVRGKNLFDKNNANVFNGYISNTSSNKLIASDTARIVYIPCSPNTTYSISKAVIGINNRFCVFTTNEVPASGVVAHVLAGAKAGTNDATSYTVTTSADAKYICAYVKAGNATATDTQIYETIQIEVGSATTYEPYSSNTYEINLAGKNLFDGVFELGNINPTTGANTSSTTTIRTKNYVAIKGGENYTISVVDGGIVAVGFYQSNGTFIGVGTTGASPNTFTAPANAGRVRFIIANNTNTSTKAQCEAGSQATAYEPYFTPIELCKLGDYQDYIWKDGEDWKIHKATSKYTLKGTEQWDSTGAGNHSCYSTAITGYATSDNVPYSPYFSGTSNVNGAGAMNAKPDNSIAFINQSATVRFYIKSSKFENDALALKTWLSTHNTDVYYALATPTDTVITNQALIDQLEALVSGGAENGTTYIKVNAIDPNLPGLLYVEAPKYE